MHRYRWPRCFEPFISGRDTLPGSFQFWQQRRGDRPRSASRPSDCDQPAAAYSAITNTWDDSPRCEGCQAPYLRMGWFTAWGF